MNKITFLLFTLCATTFFSQDKLTSSVSEFFDGSIWVPSDKVAFIYDEINNLTEETTLNWSGATSQWVKSEVSTYTYNQGNKVVVELYKGFNGVTVEMQNRITNTYNSEGEITQFLEEDYLNSNWVNTNKVDLEYDNGSLALGIVYEWSGSAWVLGEDSARVTINYNANGTVGAAVFESWQEDWVTTMRTVYSYNANNWAILESSESFDGATWLVEDKVEYTYDANGNALTIKRFNNDNGTFTLASEEINTFDTSQLMADFAHPYKDKNGIDYLFEVTGIVNKILTTTSVDRRTTYNYGESTASIPSFNLAAIKVYPTPATDVVNVSIKNGTIHKIDVFNLLGKKVLTSTESKINIENLAKGVYLLKIQSEDAGFVTKRMVKR
jgi:hypothetical protein